MRRLARAGLVIVTLGALALASTGLAQQQQGRRGPGGLGRITAISDTGFDMALGRGNRAQPAKVTISVETRYLEARRIPAGDLKVDQRVAVLGPLADGKITARGIIDLSALGAVGDRELRPLVAAIRGLGRRRMPGVNAARPAPGQRAARRPAIGKVASTNPLKVTTADGQTVEVVTGEQTAVLSIQAIAFKDLKAGDFVQVVGARQQVEGQPVSITAQAVVKVPAPVRGAGRNRNKPSGS